MGAVSSSQKPVGMYDSELRRVSNDGPSLSQVIFILANIYVCTETDRRY
jgi:hypothetical protein